MTDEQQQKFEAWWVKYKKNLDLDYGDTEGLAGMEFLIGAIARAAYDAGLKEND